MLLWFTGKNVHIFFSSVQLLNHVQLFVTPWIAALQASLSFTNSWSLPKLMSIKSVIPINHIILCHPFILLPSIFPSIMGFSNELVIHIRWPNYWSFSISPSSEYSGLISFRKPLTTLQSPHFAPSTHLSSRMSCPSPCFIWFCWMHYYFLVSNIVFLFISPC